MISASVGLPQLMTRAISMLISPSRAPDPHLIDAGTRRDSELSQSLFGFPARYEFPVRSDGQILVAGLVVRPGERSLHLTGEVWDATIESFDSVTAELESIIRDHADQWAPEFPLWDAPIEREDPSIGIARSGR